jgi:hypothetical protein
MLDLTGHALIENDEEEEYEDDDLDIRAEAIPETISEDRPEAVANTSGGRSQTSRPQTRFLRPSLSRHPTGPVDLPLHSGRRSDREPPPLQSPRPWLPQRIIPIVSCVTVSKVVTVFEFASNARCATIRFANSVEISTFDSSSALPVMVPRDPVPATP